MSPETSPISEGRAIEIATASLTTALPTGEDIRISAIASFDNATHRRLGLYGGPTGGEQEYWVIYVDRASRRMMLCSSEIVLISKFDGTIAIHGFANDEG